MWNVLKKGVLKWNFLHCPMKSGQNMCHDEKSHCLFLWLYDLLRAHTLNGLVRKKSNSGMMKMLSVKTLVTIHKFLHILPSQKKSHKTLFLKHLMKGRRKLFWTINHSMSVLSSSSAQYTHFIFHPNLIVNSHLIIFELNNFKG